MKNVYYKFVVPVLIVVLGVGSLASAATGIEACLPKACCCTNMAADMTGHDRQMEMPRSCAPEKPAPCCSVEPYQPEVELVVSSAVPVSNYRMPLSYLTANNPIETSQQPPGNTFDPFRDIGPLKYLSVPIYLQTLSIIC